MKYFIKIGLKWLFMITFVLNYFESSDILNLRSFSIWILLFLSNKFFRSVKNIFYIYNIIKKYSNFRFILILLKIILFFDYFKINHNYIYKNIVVSTNKILLFNSKIIIKYFI